MCRNCGGANKQEQERWEAQRVQPRPKGGGNRKRCTSCSVVPVSHLWRLAAARVYLQAKSTLEKKDGVRKRKVSRVDMI